MREAALFLRERQRRTAWPLDAARAFLVRHLAGWIIALASGVVMAAVGAFGTESAAPFPRFAYWIIVMVAGNLLTAVLLEIFERKQLFARSFWAASAGLVAAVTAAMTPFVWLMAAIAVNSSWRVAKMAVLAPQVLLLAAALIALQLYLERKAVSAIPAAPAPAAMPSRLMQRLPPRLAGSELYAVEAEDHYLRFHTDRGSVLLLMRLSDALAVLGAIEGAQTHRSWWVARDAVVGASRGGGRARLRLKGGLDVPVSRTFSPELRKAGWF